MQTPPVEASQNPIRSDLAEPSTAAEDTTSASADIKPKSRPRKLLRLLRRKITSWWKIVASVLVASSAAITIAFAGYVVFLSLTRNTITIEPLSTPKSLADNGYTPEVAAAQLRIALERALSAVQLHGPQLALRAEQPDIVVPSVGISAQTIANSIRKFLPISQASIISGEFTVSDGQLWLTLRSGGRDIYSNNRSVNPEQVRQLMDAAAPEILQQVWPVYLVLTSYRSSPALALEAADQIIATASPSDVQLAYTLRGMIYADQGKYRRALASFASALNLEKQPAKRAQIHLIRGFVLQQYVNSKKADEEIAKAEKLIGDDPTARLMLYLLQKRPPMEIVAEIRKVTAKHTLERGTHSDVAYILLMFGMADEAIEECQRAIRIDPDDITAYIYLGSAYSMKGQMEDAAASYRKAIDINPHDERLVTAYMSLGSILRDQGRFEEAAAGFRRVIEMPLPTSFWRFGQGIHEQPPSYVDNHTRARNALAGALREQGKLDDATAELMKNIEFEPRNAEARLELALVLRDQGKLEAAIVGLQKAVELNPSMPAAHFYLASILRDQGKSDEAIAEFRKSIRAAPQDPQSYRELGLALFNQQKTEEAVSNIQTAIKLAPNDPFAHLFLGIILRSQGKIEEAMTSLNQAAGFGPNLSQPYVELGGIYNTQGNLDEAIVALGKAIERAPEDVSARVALASTLRTRGDLDDAIAGLREILNRDPANANYIYNLATTLTDKVIQRRSAGNIGMLVEACKLFVEGKRLVPSDPDFASAMERVDRLMPRHHHCRRPAARAERRAASR